MTMHRYQCVCFQVTSFFQLRTRNTNNRRIHTRNQNFICRRCESTNSGLTPYYQLDNQTNACLLHVIPVRHKSALDRVGELQIWTSFYVFSKYEMSRFDPLPRAQGAPSDDSGHDRARTALSSKSGLARSGSVIDDNRLAHGVVYKQRYCSQIWSRDTYVHTNKFGLVTLYEICSTLNNYVTTCVSDCFITSVAVSRF